MPKTIKKSVPVWHKFQDRGEEVEFLIKPLTFQEWETVKGSVSGVTDNQYERYARYLFGLIPYIILDWKGYYDENNNPTPYSKEVAAASLEVTILNEVAAIAGKDVFDAMVVKKRDGEAPAMAP